MNHSEPYAAFVVSYKTTERSSISGIWVCNFSQHDSSICDGSRQLQRIVECIRAVSNVKMMDRDWTGLDWKSDLYPWSNLGIRSMPPTSSRPGCSPLLYYYYSHLFLGYLIFSLFQAGKTSSGPRVWSWQNTISDIPIYRLTPHLAIHYLLSLKVLSYCHYLSWFWILINASYTDPPIDLAAFSGKDRISG